MSGLVVASTNGQVGIAAAVDVLRAGGSAVDAVIAGIELVEAHPDDHSVGYSGLPNLLGEVELDASIMDGRTLAAGSVGALQHYQDAIALARQVMDTLPHVLIVGEGADRFAAETGLNHRQLLTPEAEQIWRSRMSAPPDNRDAYFGRIRDLVVAHSSDPEAPDLPPIATARSTSSPETATATSLVASAPPAGPGSTRAAWAIRRLSAPAITPTIVGAPPPVPAAAKWRSGSAPPTASSPSCASASRSTKRYARRCGTSTPWRTATGARSTSSPLTATATTRAASTDPNKTYVFMHEGMDQFEEAARTHVAP